MPGPLRLRIRMPSHPPQAPMSGGENVAFEILGVLSALAIPNGPEGAMISQAAKWQRTARFPPDRSTRTISTPRLTASWTASRDCIRSSSPIGERCSEPIESCRRRRYPARRKFYRVAADAYEVGLYMAVANATMAVVSAIQFHDWGCCAIDGVGLGYVPPQGTFNACNGKLRGSLLTWPATQAWPRRPPNLGVSPVSSDNGRQECESSLE
jgi:hypothetical protein